jgi:pimeloyl-ACP methyl ester carboxylesterase
MLLKAPGGRSLEVEIAGPADGETLLIHGGTPSVASVFGPRVEEGRERGLRHVSYSRPGYGGSDRRHGRSVGDCIEDVVAIAEALELEAFYVLGHSGGGPHALACAALLPDRVRAVATVSGLAPRHADGLDWLAGMERENQAEFAAVAAGEVCLREFLEPLAPDLSRMSAEDLEVMISLLGCPADRATITPAYAEHLLTSMSRAICDGIWGWLDDDLALSGAWGFDLAEIQVPVAVWQGDEDRQVPPAHGRWLADNVPGAHAHLLPDEGHLSIEQSRYGEVLDHLLRADAGSRIGGRSGSAD